MILSYKDFYPVIDERVFIADNAFIIGDVVLSKDVSVWFGVVIRGDVNYIRVGERTNIQDGCVLHVTHNKYPLNIGAGVTIGHNATVHGCTIKNDVLIGMGAIILDNSVINSNSIVAAGSVIKESFIVPAGVLAAGVPAKIMRDLTEDEIKNVKQSAVKYIEYAKSYKK
ncbi:MAG: gamma carbonic anhydrase family protein [Bacteroidota bacterium]|nr:gamma carbonic anhydrase family protein [Bacteroidota bacterium]